MSEKKRNAGTEEEPKSDLDSVEEALVGTHQEPGADVDDEGDSQSDDAGPSVPGHRSP